MTTDYKEFLSYENFNLAFIRLKTAPYSFYKSIYMEDLKIFELFLEDNLKTIIELIETDKFEPNSCNKIFIPKKELQVRPVYMLCFIDLLVYQAIINVIGEQIYLKLADNYNNTIFGNQINSTKDKKGSYFQYRDWKPSHRAFSNISRKAFKEGYKFILEFDISSFFDTIDQDILASMLKAEYGTGDDLLAILEKCLKKWTMDSNHKSYAGKRGIPQGPNCSACLAEAYLAYVDEEIKNKTSFDIKYYRYVDDIRIFSKNEIDLKKAAVFLEICTRDIGLISQSSKLDIREIKDIEKELKSQFNKFSRISSEYKTVTANKAKNRLEPATHQKLKEEFLSCFREEYDEENKDLKLNKTIIGFSLYKLNEDEDLRNFLIENYSKIIPHFEKVLFYLSSHFGDDEKVLSAIQDICTDPDILFRHQIALCLKYFPSLKLDKTFVEKKLKEESRHWLVKYYLVDWLFLNNRPDILEDRFNPNDNEYFTSRKLFEVNDFYKSTKDGYNDFLRMSMESENPIISINAYRRWLLNFDDKIDSQKLNDFAAKITKYDCASFANKELSTKIKNIEAFFDLEIFTETELNETMSNYGRYLLNTGFDKKNDLESLVNFIRVCIEKYCNYFKVTYSVDDIMSSISNNEIIQFTNNKKVIIKTEDLILELNRTKDSIESQMMNYKEIKNLKFKVIGFLKELIFEFNMNRNYKTFCVI